MNYKNWVHRGGAVLVETYIGTVSFEEVLKNDSFFFENRPFDQKLLVLTDVCRATFGEIPIERFEELFQSIDLHSDETHGMQLALHTGMNRFEDFQKVGKYANAAKGKPYSVLIFNALDTAMTWLGLTDKERELITAQLKEP